MKKRSIRTVAVACAFMLVLSVLSSCNRGGYGCPYELDIPGMEICYFVK